MKNLVIAIQSFVITTIVYALLVPVFFKMENNTFVEEKNFVDDDNDKTTYSQLLAETKECKSPCSSTAEMCIALCA
ncbi:MAG: hypothetical protein ACRD6U_08090 [Nitrososphaeraceae archaeon]